MPIIEDALVWVDCEMTGLDVDKCRLLEIAVIVTDPSLETVIPGPDLVIHQPCEILDSMNEWCKGQFGWRSPSDFDQDKLAAACLKSQVSEADAETQILAFLSEHVAPGKGVLAGNTVHMDKRFLDKYTPRFSQFLHYRIVDVSTVKELCRRWNPEIYTNAPYKKASHRALEDIQDSINELAHYKKTFFQLPA